MERRKRLTSPGASTEGALALRSVIVGADPKVRNAFWATLRNEPSETSGLHGPNTSNASNAPNATQEVDAADVLEVTDLAHAIARAEEVIRARSSTNLAQLTAPDSSSSRDIFDALVSTDDAAGPALAASAYPSPSPSASGMSLLLDEDAFYHPTGRIRGLADVTLDGFRPEPTLMVRLRARRRHLSWIVLGIVTPLAFVAIFTVAHSVGRTSAARELDPSSVRPLHQAEAVASSTRPVGPSTSSVAALAAPISTTAPISPTMTLPARADIPVFDIKSLKSAPPAPRPSRKP